MKSIFSKILDGEIPSEIIFQDDLCFCIRDINPRAPVHLLIIPKKPIISLAHLEEDDEEIIGHMLMQLQPLAEQAGIGGHFKTQIHTGSGGGQEVFHLHFHLLGDPTNIPND